MSAHPSPVYASAQTMLREFVVTQQLQPGARLPSERELARRLGISRTSLRQALTALRVEGLIEVRRGDGIYLLRDPTDVIPPIAAELCAANPDLPALGEVRNALEALAARSAALRRTDADLGEMVGALRLMEAEVAEGNPGLMGDYAFHASVRVASHNEVLDRLLLLIADGAKRIAQASLSRPGQPERSLAAHRLILDAIVAREPEDAHRLMYDHLELTGRFSNGEPALTPRSASDRSVGGKRHFG
jgi:GntR family transcriptional repressor for pyruvate dehydrogenase complex